MKQRNLPRRRVFWGKWLDLWLVCWVVYCACEYLLLRLLFRETMPHLRVVLDFMAVMDEQPCPCGRTLPVLKHLRPTAPTE